MYFSSALMAKSRTILIQLITKNVNFNKNGLKIGNMGIYPSYGHLGIKAREALQGHATDKTLYRMWEK